MSKTIDYLFEDPPITGQTYALVSIVGPHMPQKCDVWGLKIRGVCNTLDQAKSQTQKLMNIDNNYDIYTVEVGKFFPLAVDPLSLQNVEYQNKQLNDLIKGYLENREAANQEWYARKNEMVREAIREGKEQNSDKKEHPIVVLQSIQTLKDKMEQLTEELKNTENKLVQSILNFNNYDKDDRETSVKELNKALDNVDNGTNKMNELNNHLDEEFKFALSVENLNELLDEIKDLENRLVNLGMDSNEEDVETLKTELENKKKELNDKSNASSINKFINSNYKNSPYNSL
jgi:hypothetical protein